MHQQALVLTYCDGARYRETAVAIGCRVQNVAYRVAAAPRRRADTLDRLDLL